MLGNPYPAGFPEVPFQVKGQISHKGEARRRVMAVYGVAEGQKARLEQVIKYHPGPDTQPRILMEIPGRLLPDKRLHLLPQLPISRPARFDLRRLWLLAQPKGGGRGYTTQICSDAGTRPSRPFRLYNGLDGGRSRDGAAFLCSAFVSIYYGKLGFYTCQNWTFPLADTCGFVLEEA